MFLPGLQQAISSKPMHRKATCSFPETLSASACCQPQSVEGCIREKWATQTDHSPVKPRPEMAALLYSTWHSTATHLVRRTLQRYPDVVAGADTFRRETSGVRRRWGKAVLGRDGHEAPLLARRDWFVVQKPVSRSGKGREGVCVAEVRCREHGLEAQQGVMAKKVLRRRLGRNKFVVNRSPLVTRVRDETVDRNGKRLFVATNVENVTYKIAGTASNGRSSSPIRADYLLSLHFRNVPRSTQASMF